MVFMALSFRLGTAVSQYFVFGLRYVLRINLNGTLGNALTGDPTLFEKHWTGAGRFCGAGYFRHARLTFLQFRRFFAFGHKEKTHCLIKPFPYE
ncbi:MAG TPA: hypothetical protein VKF81_15105 [Blastocatellia bacterium]|nr:hypothetical protein [Blastocatellia bacterium]